MARTVRDVALGLNILSGTDGIDPYAVPLPASPIPDFDLALPKLKIGYCPEGPFEPVSKDIQSSVVEAAYRLASLGCSVEEIDLSHWNSWSSQSISMAFFLGEGAYYLDPIIKGKEKERRDQKYNSKSGQLKKDRGFYNLFGLLKEKERDRKRSSAHQPATPLRIVADFQGNPLRNTLIAF